MADRPYHHGNLRAALLAQAEQTLRQHGLDGLSLRELARQIGVSHAAPRRHFADRQALLDALAESGFARLGAELRGAAEMAGEDYEARLRATNLAYVRFAINDAADRAFLVILQLIEEGQAGDALEPGDPERIGLLLFATMQGIAALVTAGMVAPEQVDSLVADAIARFLHGPRIPA